MKSDDSVHQVCQQTRGQRLFFLRPAASNINGQHKIIILKKFL